MKTRKRVIMLALATLMVLMIPLGAVAAPRQGWSTDKTGQWSYYSSGKWFADGWHKIGGKWYLFDSDGYMLTGWQMDGSTWYYLKPAGDMMTGWLRYGGLWYYLKPSGAMATGWVKVGSAWYYMSGSGAMLADQWVGDDKYYLGADGAWIPDMQKPEEAPTPTPMPTASPTQTPTATPTTIPTPTPTFTPVFTPTPTSTPAPISTPTPTQPPTASTIRLSSGNYTAGVHFPAGKYNIVAVEGGGNVISSMIINAIMGVEDNDFYHLEYKNITFPSGAELRLNGVTVDLIPVTSTPTATTPVQMDLISGYYVAGEDFAAGTYDIVAIRGGGNVISMFIINAIMGVADDGFYTREYKNVTFPKGAQLEVSGLTIRLIPVR